VVERLGGALDHDAGQGDPFIAPDASYLIFRGYGEDSLGNGDLYISFNVDGEWTARKNLGAPINSTSHEMCSYVTGDGRFFIFSSNRITNSYSTKPSGSLDRLQSKFISADNGNQNIYYRLAAFIETLRSEVLAERETQAQK